MEPKSVEVNTENLLLRPETPADHARAENLTREAFWNRHGPGCNEHYLLHVMRGDAAFVPELCFVAEVGGKLVGSIAYTRCAVVTGEGEREVLSFGPVAVLPEYQGRGVGGALIRRTMDIARDMGFSAILIYGDPAYYSRFGFAPAEEYGIRTADNMYAAALQARELLCGALSGLSGRFVEAEVYNVDEASAAEFDKAFPRKKRLSGTPSQKRFLEVASARRSAEV